MESPRLTRPTLPIFTISNSPDTDTKLNSSAKSSKLSSLSFEMDRGLPTPGFPFSISGFYTHVNKATPAWSDAPDLSCSLHDERNYKLPSNLLRRRFPKMNIKPESLSPTYNMHNPMSSYGYQVPLERISKEVVSVPRYRNPSNYRNTEKSEKRNKGYLIPTEKHINCQREIKKYKSSSVEPFVPINPHAAKAHIYRKVHGFTCTPYELKKDLEFSDYKDNKMKWPGKAFRTGVVNKLV